MSSAAREQGGVSGIEFFRQSVIGFAQIPVAGFERSAARRGGLMLGFRELFTFTGEFEGCTVGLITQPLDRGGLHRVLVH